ncbi:ATP phosphoribosyltransferase [Corynebacterium choanae]|uniref:ATP phosphoribosyltransferase n=1 Tax=Corynebacterium choanae TaxID=1862358 RepID=A0A3G6J651_9CORY|nr:ATP phosphoribosyltransferase [Corynebacterium choanae]AZA13575.1 ATP phosphoribosyltransferase [Corynebacterium choanae]
MLKVALPNKGSLSETAVEILTQAGYRGRKDTKTLSVLDERNEVELFFLRPKDIAIYVAGGQLDVGITGRDLAKDAAVEVEELLSLGFGASTFRYAGPADAALDVRQLNGARIATSYPNLVRADLAERGYNAEVIRLDGAVEISIKLGVADFIADVVSTGGTLRKHGLAPFGEPLLASEAVVIARPGAEDSSTRQRLLSRIEGILHARDYLMLDYNVAAANLPQAQAITPGVSGPTVSPLTRQGWVAVRALVPRRDANAIMDELSALGGEAILATEISIARL